VDVQNRVGLALPQLPQAVQEQGVSVQKKSSAFMMIISIYSPDGRYDPTYVANYASIYVLDAIKRIPGAGQASIFGTPDYAMRIWLKPDRMAALGITASDVQQAVANQNQQFAVGSIGQSPTGRPVEQRLAASIAAATLAALKGAKILRVHDVAETSDALAVLGAIEEGVGNG